ncbi:hypothetical protein GCM10023334_013280 [Nonomuraea thailandensis]
MPWLWVGPLCILAGSGLTLLFSLGAKGAEISTVISLPAGVVSAIFTILTYAKTGRDSSAAGSATKWPPWTKKLLIATLAIALGMGVATFWWGVVHRPDTDIIDQIEPRAWPNTKANATISVKIPGNPPERRYLALRFALTNHSPVGDCVVPAHFYVSPDFYRKGKAPIDDIPTIRASEELRLDIGEATGRVEVDVTLIEPDQECVVDVELVEAILFN